MPDDQFKTPFGAYKLQRLPRQKDDTLRAWDAADENLLNTLSEYAITPDQLLICNDAFGALSVALHKFHPTSWSDSTLAHKALRKNLAENNLEKNYMITIIIEENSVVIFSVL